MFYETRNGTFINLDLVREIRASSRKVGADEYAYSIGVEWTDGSRESYDTNGLFDPRDHIRTIVPAAAGFTLLVYYFEAGKEFITRSPVIAWDLDIAMDEYHKAHALEPAAGNAVGSALLQPNGAVVDLGNAAWESEDKWIEEMRRKAAAAA